MKLNSNPLLKGENHEYENISAQVLVARKWVQKYRRALSRKIRLLKTLARNLDRGKKVNLRRYFNTLNRMEEKIRHIGSPSLRDMSAPRYFWYHTGPHEHQRELVSFPQLHVEVMFGTGPRTFKSLMGKKAGRKKLHEKIIELEQLVEYYEAVLRRMTLMSRFHKQLAAAPMTGDRLDNDVKASQTAMLLRAGQSLEYIQGLVKRLRTESRKTGAGRNRARLVHQTRQLMDEVDRVASQVEFNRFSLFQGNFAPASRLASLRFISAHNKERKVQVFIPTMSANALGLDWRRREKMALSQPPGRRNRILDAALSKIQTARKNTNNSLKQLKTEPPLKPPKPPSS